MWSRLVFVLLFSTFAFAQASSPVIGNDFVHQQFGDSCNLESKWKTMTGDLNSDGVEDVVMVARCKNPLIDQDEKSFQVIDPMNTFFGYGNPKITSGSGFGQDDPKLKGICVLVIHGSGAEGWHSATPQAKFLIINIAVKTIAVKKMKVTRKKIAPAIYVEEATGDQMTSAIYWDGKKYRYTPIGSSME
jgi:hypothetical protein